MTGIPSPTPTGFALVEALGGCQMDLNLAAASIDEVRGQYDRNDTEIIGDHDYAQGEIIDLMIANARTEIETRIHYGFAPGDLDRLTERCGRIYEYADNLLDEVKRKIRAERNRRVEELRRVTQK